MEMTVAIKNMVCQHCVNCVRNVLGAMPGVTVLSVWLGGATVDVAGNGADYLPRMAEVLAGEGFELIKTRDAEMVDSVKRVLIEMSRRAGGVHGNLSELLMDEMKAWSVTYASLSRLFSSMEGRTMENYFMSLRVERVKELIKYGQQTLSEIAFDTGYSSVAHLSRQFKQHTGMTPTEFRSMGARKPLQDV